MARASALVEHLEPDSLDLLVLPELAFSGYNFPNLAAIIPYLEHAAAGPSADWARRTAQRLRCTVIVGYPEVTSDGQRYNSTVMIGRDGLEIGRGYRKSFLYYTDETWASEGSGFHSGLGELRMVTSNDSETPFTKIAQGICMDLNPYAFKAPWDAYEFATHVVESGVDAAVLSMAWLAAPPDLSTEESDTDAFVADESPLWSDEDATKPHIETLLYWLRRLTPLIARERYTIVVLANRCGREGNAVYAGTSCILRVGYGRTMLYSIMARGEEGFILVDTEQARLAEITLASRREEPRQNAEDNHVHTDDISGP